MMWDQVERHGLQQIVVPEWERQGVVHAFTTRTGGFSRGNFDSLNLGLHVGDDPETVIANRRLVTDSLGIDLTATVTAEQVHGNRVAVVTSRDQGRGAESYQDSIPGCDALICDQPGVILMEFFADCIPVYFFDPVKRAVGLAHCGWKGTVQGMAARTALAMAGAYGCRPGDIQVFIGPGIGPECYQIDEDRKDRVEQVFTFTDRIIYPLEKRQYRWDLKLTNRLVLQELGIPEENISTCGLCTNCHRDSFFSYRGANGTTGRMAALIGLRDGKGASEF
jgi:YfiH family protein